MIIRIFGKNEFITYNINECKKTVDDKDVFVCEPKLVKMTSYEEEQILTYDGELRYNNDCKEFFLSGKKINISKDETVRVEKEIFRADLNELHVFVDKVLSTTDVNKTEKEFLFYELMREFNKTMIESNENLKSYCDIHKLCYEDTNVFELAKLLYPEKYCYIEDGKLRTENELCIKAYVDSYSKTYIDLIKDMTEVSV